MILLSTKKKIKTPRSFPPCDGQKSSRAGSELFVPSRQREPLINQFPVLEGLGPCPKGQPRSSASLSWPAERGFNVPVHRAAELGAAGGAEQLPHLGKAQFLQHCREGGASTASHTGRAVIPAQPSSDQLRSAQPSSAQPKIQSLGSRWDPHPELLGAEPWVRHSKEETEPGSEAGKHFFSLQAGLTGPAQLLCFGTAQRKLLLKDLGLQGTRTWPEPPLSP